MSNHKKKNKQSLVDRYHIAQTQAVSNGMKILTDAELKQMHRTLLEIYGDVKRVCEKYGITPIAAGGTALGAVRHRGFIPWDDDLDLFMFRADFERFSSVFDKELGDGYYLLAPNGPHGANGFLPRVLKKNTTMFSVADERAPYPQCIYIDINILDHAPANKAALFVRAVTADLLRFISYSVYLVKYKGPSFERHFLVDRRTRTYYRIRFALGRLMAFCSPEKWFSIFDDFIASKKETGYYTAASGRKGYAGERIEKSLIFPLERVPFEDTEICLFHDSDAYLKNLYGDYMTVPPLEKQERHPHFLIDFEREISMKEYNEEAD